MFLPPILLCQSANDLPTTILAIERHYWPYLQSFKNNNIQRSILLDQCIYTPYLEPISFDIYVYCSFVP